MPTIGVASILVTPQFSKLQQTVGRELDGVAAPAGKSAGSKMGAALGGALKVGALAAGGAVIGGLGLALTRGFNRLRALEDAKAKLSGLGYTAKQVGGIMADVNAAVKGTSFGLDEAATAAAGALGAGVKQGKELESYLKLVGDMTTQSNTDFNSMAQIMAKVQGQGKLTGETLAQMSDNGLQAMPMLTKAYGVSAAEMTKMVSSGKVDSERFKKIMEDNIGGSALKSGETLSGAFKNTLSSIGRIGANLLTGVYPKIQAFFSNAIDWLKPLEDGAKVAGEAIGNFLNDGLSAVKGISDILFKGKYTGGIFGIEEDSKFVDFLFNVRDNVKNLASFIKTDLIPGLRDFGKWILDNKDWLAAIGVTIGTMAVGMKLWTGAIAAWKAITATATAIQLAFNLAMTANPIGLIIVGIAALVAGLVYFFTQTETGKKIVEVVFAAIKAAIGAVVTWFQTYVMPVVKQVFGVIGAVFNWLWTNVVKPVFGFIQTFIGAVFLVVRGVFQLVVSVVKNVLAPAFSWLWNTIIKPVFQAIGDFIGWVWKNVVTPIFNAIKWYINNVLAPVFTWLYKTIIKPAFDGIGAAIKWAWDKVIKPVFDFLHDAISKTVPKAFQTGVDAIKRIWNTILDIAKAPVRFVINTVINDGLIGAFNKIAGILPGIDKLPRVALPKGFASGGWTGPGSKYQPAGIVHADEFVVNKAARRGIEGRAPGLLDALNTMGAKALGMLGYANGGRVWPTKSKALTQGYTATHDGIDIGVPTGTPVFATANGAVDWAGPGVQLPGIWGGNEIHIMGGGLETWFGHLSQIGVKLGQQVKAGQQIGLSGNTGITSGPHLHFGVYNGGYPNSMNPLAYLSGAGAPSGGKGGGWLDPLGFIRGLAEKVVGQVKAKFPAGGFMIDAVAGVGKKLFGSVIDWAKGKLGMGATAGPQHGAHLDPLLYDQGGILRPGLSNIVNRTGKPEAILNPKQWADIHHLATVGQGGGRGDVIFQGNVGWDPNEVANRIETKRRDTFAAFGI